MAIIGILAAIAIPQYQDYIARAQASEGAVIASGLELAISESIASAGVGGCAMPASSVTSGKYVASTTVSATATTCAVVSTFAATGVSTPIQNQTLTETVTFATGAWTCSTSLPAALKPKGCT